MHETGLETFITGKQGDKKREGGWGSLSPITAHQKKDHLSFTEFVGAYTKK